MLVEVFLDLSDVYGFLRFGTTRSSKEDANVVGKLEYQFGLCKGVQLVGTRSRPVNRFEKNSEMSTIDSIQGANPERASCRLAENDTTQRRGSSISSV